MSRKSTGQVGSPPLVQVIKEWAEWRKHSASPMTRANQLYTLAHWVRTMKASDTLSIDSIDEGRIGRFVNTTDPITRSARNGRLRAIRSLFHFAVKGKAYIAANPSELVKVRMAGLPHALKETKGREIVTPAEYLNLMEDAEGFTRYAIALAYWVGLRLSDICCFEWDSYDEPSGLLTVWTNKRDTRVQIDLHDIVFGGGIMVQLLAELRNNGDPDEDYPFEKERETILDPMRRSNISVYMLRHFKRAGVDGKSFHCLRHSFATRLKAAGKTLEQIGRAIGHTNLNTTAGYVHSTPTEAEEIIADI